MGNMHLMSHGSVSFGEFVGRMSKKIYLGKAWRPSFDRPIMFSALRERQQKSIICRDTRKAWPLIYACMRVCGTDVLCLRQIHISVCMCISAFVIFCTR